MSVNKKAALILEDWINIMDSLPPKDYKAVFSAICRFRISGSDPPGDMTAHQKTILGLMMREANLMDEKAERVKRWREKKKEELQLCNSNATVMQEKHNSNVTSSTIEIEREIEREIEIENTPSECGCIGAEPEAEQHTDSPPPAIDAEEKKKLVADGIPAAYVDYFCDVCEAKGYKYNRPTSACRAWWKKDKNRQEWQQPSGQSFDTNEFFDAALRKSIGDNENT